MATMVLQKSWKVEDVVDHLGLLMHAAFLHAGFVPYGPNLFKQSDETGSSLCLSRRYTAPQLAHRKDADAAVLMLCAVQGGGDYIALVIFLTTGRDPRSPYLELLNVATVAHALESTEAERSRIRASLGNAVCWGLLHELCRRNGLPLRGLTSLPDDAKVEILKRLRSGEDLARVECTCRDLRRVVAARDGELWKHIATQEAPPSKAPMDDYIDIVRYEEWKATYDSLRGRWIDYYEYEALRCCAHLCRWRPFVPVDVKGLPRWKEEYLRDRNRLWAGSRFPFRWSWRRLLSAPQVSWRLRDLHHHQVPADVDHETSSRRRNIQDVPRKDYSNKRDNRRHGPAGAVHSPSFRNRWKHR
ncbi:unnamed protein product [Urochloa humidicola]